MRKETTNHRGVWMRKPLQNIVLLACRSPFLDNDKVYPPLANLYLHSIIKKTHPNTQVTIMDDYDLEDPSWLRHVDGVGVSIMTPQRTEASRILEFVKTNKPEIPVFAGGPHVKYYLTDLAIEPWDHLVPNDGERTISKIIDGTPWRVLDDKISIKDYAAHAVKPARRENETFLRSYNYTLNGRDSTTMLTARGCPEQCTFCEDAMTSVRWTPFDLIKEELDDIKNLGYSGVYIFDDIFAIAQKKVRPIAEELGRRDLIYRCNGQARHFNEDFAQMLSSTGCVEIAFGAESGSQKILDNIRKRTTVEQNYRFVELCNQYGIRCKAFLMLGLPGENAETIAATENFIKNSGIQDFQLSIYYPYKGTQIRDAIERGEQGFDLRFNGEGLGAYGQKGGSTEAVVRTEALSTEDLLRERDRLVQTYRPQSHKEKWTDKFFDTHLGDAA